MGDGTETNFIRSKCDINLNDCYSKTILKGIGDDGSSNPLDTIDSNYLAFSNGNPYIKSCPSPKFYHKNEAGILARGEITNDNLKAKTDPHLCYNVIGEEDSSWNDDVIHSLLFLDAPIEDQNITEDAVKVIKDSISGAPNNIEEIIRSHVILLKPTFQFYV